MKLSRIRGWVLVCAGAVALGGLVWVAVKGLPGPRSGNRATHQTSVLETSEPPNVNKDIDPGSPAGDVSAPGFVLHDQQGRTTSLSQFRGKVVVLAFVDSHCTTICPLTTQSMLDAVRILGPAAGQVQLLGINANPLATKTADVAAYTRAHQMEGRWRFLTGSLSQLKTVWRNYHVYVAAIHNDIDHEPIIYLIGPRGRERTIYITQMSYEGVSPQAQVLAEGIARLLPGHPVVRREVSLKYVPPIGPGEQVELPAVGSGHRSVTLGDGHSHLLVFFADWLQESSNLTARFAELDRYATTARREGWPEPVAVDELSTEASPARAHLALEGISARGRVPVVEDVQGRLGDGYHVEDLPWFMLVSGSGKILWHHDGWLTADVLERQVRAALAGH